MENASRALIMAASVLIGIIIISAFVLMMSNLTGYQTSSYTSTSSSQIAEFNNQYTTYLRSGLRGSDIVSLINKVVDYNTRKTEEGYEKLELTLTIGSSTMTQLSYDGTNRLVLNTTYTSDTISNLVTEPKEIENTYQEKYAKQLASNISNIKDVIDNYTSTSARNTAFDELGLLPNNASTYEGGVTQIYQDALVYYEYVQFKRTTWDCAEAETQFDANTGRILTMEFGCTGIGV